MNPLSRFHHHQRDRADEWVPAMTAHDQRDDYVDPLPPMRPWSRERVFWVGLTLAALFYGFVAAIVLLLG